MRLLQRTTRRVTVTEVGQTYYQHCAALEAEALAAQEAIDRTRSAPQGTVRMSCPISLMNGGVSPILAKFLAANPLVRVYVDMTNRRVDVVEEGFDLAIRVRRLPLEPTNLAMRKLGESEGVVVGHPALLARLGRPAHPNDIARYPTLSMTTAGDRYSWQFREKDGSQISVESCAAADDGQLRCFARGVCGGVGLAYVPQFVVHRDIQRGELERVLPEFGLGAGLAHVVFPSRRGMVPAVRALLDALVEGFNEAGPTVW